MTGWKFDAQKLVADLEAAGHRTSVKAAGNTVYLAQVATGLRTLGMGEFLAMSWLAGWAPARYIIEVK